MKKISLKKSWEKISEIYQKEFYYNVWPKMDADEIMLLKNIKNKRILDIGCGGGQESIILAKKGAIVTGIDFSKKQIEFAKKLAKKEKVKVNFLIKNIERLDMFPKNSFDIVYSSYALQYIENLKRVFKEVYKILKPKGIFILALDHPIFLSGNWMKYKGKKCFLIGNYFKRGKRYWKWEFKGGKIKVPFYCFHRTIQDFFDLFLNNGFVIENFIEPEVVKKSKKEVEPYTYKKMKKIPYKIIFKAVKK
ncbi:MAG: class I SAM-dependent methyltransferase [Candidatus Aenigmatarchaeota archaeon]